MKTINEWLDIYKEIWNKYKCNTVRLTLGQQEEDSQWGYIELIEFNNRSLSDFEELISFCKKFNLRISLQDYSQVRLYEDHEGENR